MTETIAQIKQALKTAAADDVRLANWRQDDRQGVQQALAAFDRRQIKLAEQKAAFLSRFSEERPLWQQGFSAIAGVDEVGRGPLAGPVVAAAVILPKDFDQYGVIDSKQVSPKHRQEYVQAIRDEAVAYGIGVVSAEVIDEVNIYQASRLAMKEAVENLQPMADYLLVDAMQIDVDLPQQSLIKGDARSNSIGAASILAKVTRDEMMVAYDQEYPGYDFAHNAGYGTAKHLAGLKELGPSPIHRKTFEPVKQYLQ
ncbi:ribonuclease HII [Fructobacillus pseudoficulneus]|uniref:Ribonuclease HII n=1 Tax=Fructobacillus pseudoficulneus TaxID=220714 RepID=A0A3F3H544_9LACO|nr:ribonuclease HII [Fructobacillus pseudoficulneus]GAP02159.1 ribonuclease HII [Fructobacillus pseudoficulneus]SEH35932.1 RNase HII [Fructobacillus pseudoficulneus]